MYTWSHGKMSLVTRTGTVIPGVGTVQGVMDAGRRVSCPFGTRVNDRGQVLFTAKLQGTETAGSDVLLVATATGTVLRRAGVARHEDAELVAATARGSRSSRQ